MKKNMIRLFALLLAMLMVLPLAACEKNPTGNTSEETSESGDASEVSSTAAEEVQEKWTVDYKTNTVNAGSITTAEGSTAGGEVSYKYFKGKEGKDYTDTEFYTFNDYMTSNNGLKWSTHTWETNEDSYILDMISVGFYGFALNETADGWAVTCEMASELPVDVTSQYVGKYGISEGDTAKAWKIALNKDACWEDGTPINADTYIYSYKELLDPVMKNRRADSLYAGDFVIYGAKNYFYQGQTAASAIGVTAAEYLANGGKLEDLYVDVANFWGIIAPDGSNYVSVLDETLIRDPAVAEGQEEDYVSGKYLYDNYLAAGAPYEAYGADYLCVVESYEANYSWDNVGILKTGDYELVMITVNPTADANYYVPYNLSGTYLVYEPQWEAAKKYFNEAGDQVEKGSEGITQITTDVCTTAENTMSYGPYKLTYFELDKQITLERNDKWYGYKDGKHVGQYQTDKVSCQIIDKQETQLLAFLKGELDNVSLTADNMAQYGQSEYVRYSPETYTTKISFNTDAAKTAERGTQILTNANFRKAFALAIDKNGFASSLTTGTAGFGILNTLYVYDPFTGAAYRNTEGAKKALVELYELTYGKDGEYGSLDEAYEAITGYNVTAAKTIMAQAYTECVEAGLYKEGDKVELQLSVYQEDEIYVKMYNFLKNALEAACAGTGFEGNVTLKMVADDDYYNTMYSGMTDIIFTTWGGAAYSPYTILYECYCDAADGTGNQMELGYDTSKINVTIVADGVTYTAPLQTWALWADSSDPNCVIKSADGTAQLKEFAAYDAATKAMFYGKLEYAYLAFFTTTPIYYRSSASMLSQKGDYAVKQYVDLVGFGGLQFYTYNYTDSAWAEYVSSGNLKY